MAKKNSLLFDAKYVIAIFCVIVILLFVIMIFQSIDFLKLLTDQTFKFDVTQSSLKSIVDDYRRSIDISAINSILITIYTSLLGFLITTISILLVFDFTKNSILARINKVGLLDQIFERVNSTLYITFISLIFTAIYYLISFKYSNFILEIILLVFLVLVLLRIYRVIYILYEIQNSLIKSEKNKQKDDIP